MSCEKIAAAACHLIVCLKANVFYLVLGKVSLFKIGRPFIVFMARKFTSSTSRDIIACFPKLMLGPLIMINKKMFTRDDRQPNLKLTFYFS